MADCRNGTATDLHPQQLIEQRLGLAETQRESTAQQTHQNTEQGAVATELQNRRQRRAGAGRAAGADQPMPLVTGHQRRDRRNLDHLMARRRQSRLLLRHLVHPLDRKQLRTSCEMALLSAPLAGTTFTALWRPKTQPVTGGRLGRIARAATKRISSLAPAGQFSQSASEIPAGCVLITSSLCLRCNRE